MNVPTKIRKRSGDIVLFDITKIETAILKAGHATKEFGINEAKVIAKDVIKNLSRLNTIIPNVEQVQDVVENSLINFGHMKTAKAYIIYREKHRNLREINSINQVKLVDSYLDKLDWQIKENSNMAFSLQGLNNYISSEISKNYWLNKIYSGEIAKAHQAGDFHIHDLNLLSVYCVGWDLVDLLKEGFKGVPGKVASKPAKHFRSALGQIVNFFYTLQGEAAGAQAFSNFDTLLAPFVRYDNLDYAAVKQALQEFVFNVNVSTRVGFQTPFTNITLDLAPPSHLAMTPIIIGGKWQKTNYADYQNEMDIINKALLEVLTEGDANGRVFTFPIPTYNITKDFDWDNKIIKNLWETAAKYGIPYFSNFINSELKPEDARSMCCRLRIDNRQLEHRGGGLFGANPLTGSIGVVTLNLPRLSLKSKNLSSFYIRLNSLLNLAKDSLETKRKTIEKYTDLNLYPYTKYYLRDIKKASGQYWRNHFSTIGIIGMNEALMNLVDTNIGTENGQKLANEIMDYIREKLITFQQETGNNYNLEATPAEGTTYRLAQKDQKDFKDKAQFANGKGLKVKAPFYTNSTHLPVNYTDDLFELLDLQDNLQTKYTGGTVLHFFLGERVDDPEIIKTLVKTICTKYKLPYFTFSPSFSVCNNHGYISGEHISCPKCHEPCEVYSRVVGFLRPVSQWNDGKVAEFELRKKFDKATKI